jgi:hypothetical protein
MYDIDIDINIDIDIDDCMIILAVVGLLCFQVFIRIDFSISVKNYILMDIALNL